MSLEKILSVIVIVIGLIIGYIAAEIQNYWDDVDELAESCFSGDLSFIGDDMGHRVGGCRCFASQIANQTSYFTWYFFKGTVEQREIRNEKVVKSADYCSKLYRNPL